MDHSNSRHPREGGDLYYNKENAEREIPAFAGMTALVRSLATLAGMTFLLVSCIVVHDFGEYWGKGYVDPALAGTWLDGKGNSMTFLKDGDSYKVFYSQRDEEIEAARTLKLGDATFLMVKEKKRNISGSLNLYAFVGGKLSFYVPNPDKKDDFIANYGNSGIRVNRNSVEVEKLEPQIADVLLKITQEPKYWEISKTYARAKLEK